MFFSFSFFTPFVNHSSSSWLFFFSIQLNSVYFQDMRTIQKDTIQYNAVCRCRISVWCRCRNTAVFVNVKLGLLILWFRAADKGGKKEGPYNSVHYLRFKISWQEIYCNRVNNLFLRNHVAYWNNIFSKCGSYIAMLYLTEAMEWMFGRTKYTTLTQETAIPIVSTNSQHWKTFTATKVIFFLTLTKCFCLHK